MQPVLPLSFVFSNAWDVSVERPCHRRPRERPRPRRVRGRPRVRQRHGAPPETGARADTRPKGHGALWRPRRCVLPSSAVHLTAKTSLLAITRTSSHCERPAHACVSPLFSCTSHPSPVDPDTRPSLPGSATCGSQKTVWYVQLELKLRLSSF